MSSASPLQDTLEGVSVIQVIPKLVGGGAERAVIALAEGVAAHGGHSLVVSSGGPMADQLQGSPCTRAITLPVESKNPLLLAHNARALERLIEEEEDKGRAVLIHAHSRAPAWSCLAAARRGGRPFLTTYHGAYSARTNLKRLYNSVMVRGDRIIAHSRFIAEDVAAQYSGKPYFDPERLITIPLGADLDRFLPGAIDAAAVAKAAAAFPDHNEGTLKVVLPGRFTSWKGQEVLIEALGHLKQTAPNISISAVMVGRMDEKPAYVDRLRAAIHRLGFDDRIALLPAREEVAPLLRAADVVVSASTDPEAFGLVAIEAQAAGRPVIATAHGGSLETVLDGETGLLVRPGDVQALASALQTFHDHSPEKREAMGARGTEHASTHFSLEAMMNATMAIYASVRQGWESRGAIKR